MRIFSSINTSASALTAERLRMDVIANNIANAGTTRTEAGGPYRRQLPVFASRTEAAQSFANLLMNKSVEAAAGAGVQVVAVVQDPRPFKLVYDPGHPDARPDGYVEMPNVDIVSEMVDMISATRAYEANVAAINAAKNMAMKALDIGRG